MTAATVSGAIKEMIALFKPYWDTTGFPAEYPNRKALKTDALVAYARFRVQHETGGQASLANVSGKTRQRVSGFLQIEVCAPIGDGIDDAYELAEGVMNCYRGKRTPSDVWFRDVRMGEASNPHHFQVNVIVEFTYDQIN